MEIARYTRVAIVCRQLVMGGAERQLVALLRGIPRDRVQVHLLVFYAGGELWPELHDLASLRVVDLRKRGRWDVVPFLVRAYRAVKAINPDVIYGYQNVAMELSAILGGLTGSRVAWGVRASDMDLRSYDALAGLVFRAGARLSRFASVIIFNSQRGLAHYLANGYAPARTAVIPNGIDASAFRPDPGASAALRSELHLPDGVRLVGCAGRFDPMKDYDTFLAAAASVAARHPEVHFVLAGPGVTADNAVFHGALARGPLASRLHVLGPRMDMPALLSALDLVVSSSAFGEGFSNVIAEAMACGVPCVATDTGDAAVVLGDTGVVVPVRRPDALAAAVSGLLERPQDELRALGAKARARIVDGYSVARMQARTFEMLESLHRA